MISKELLSDVLGYRVSKSYIDDTQDVQYVDVFLEGDDTGIYDSINIYELAHKCKEWAWSLHPSSLFIGTVKEEIKWCCFVSFGVSIQPIYNETRKTFYESTEPEAIFKACQWIVENKEVNEER
jgi:hypothetical protein